MARPSLYWCTTPDGDEDWFVVASSARAARSFHERAEGYEAGSASAERVVTLPPHLRDGSAWRDPGADELSTRAAWPSDALIEACGGEIAELPTDALRDQVGVVCRLIRFGERVFRAGDVIENRARVMGVPLPPRLGVFRGGKRG
ncbi:MAG: hypothetical protein IPM35_20540 [Myxococcales bacterium]|nr:hypothetical protein [Myxococcales bacterium]